MITMVEESCHPVFTQDPAHWMQYIYKKVRVVTGPNQEHVGHVYTVDPVTFSFVLVRFPSDATSVAEATTTSTTTTAIATATNGAEATTTSTSTTAAIATATNGAEASDIFTTTTNPTTTAIATSGTITTTTKAKASDTSTTTIATTTTTATTTKTSVEVCVIPGHAVVDVVVVQENDGGCDGGGGTREEDRDDYKKIKARLDALFLNSNNSINLDYDISGTNSSSIGHLSEEALMERRDKLKSWLVKNRLPVQELKRGEDGDKGQCLCVAGAVTILPPYGPSNCCSTNEIILSRIQNLVRNMPPTV